MRFRPTIPDELSLPFESQRVQYPEVGEAGLEHRIEQDGHFPDRDIHCILWRDESGRTVGILNYYPHDFPPYELAGNVNVYIDPDHARNGVASRLMEHALEHWDIDFTQQNYTVAGARFAEAFVLARQRERKGASERGRASERAESDCRVPRKRP